MGSPLPSTQLSLRPYIVELGVGQPDPELLPRKAIEQATTAALESGWTPLAYGANAGPESLLSQLSRRISAAEREVSLDEIIVTGGNSQALDELCTLLAQPGDAVLVESPSYNLALEILRDHHLTLVPVPFDEEGLVPMAVGEVASSLRQKGVRPAFLYTIPTFHNPTGISLTLPRRHELLEVAASVDLPIVEDDVYRDLVYDGAAPPSLWALDRSDVVIRIGTFSKILAPGLRVGWMTAPRAIIGQLANDGLRMSGGGVSHFSAMTAGELMAAHELEPHLESLRSVYRERRDALSAAFNDLIPEAEHQLPAGGYFLWLRLPGSIDTEALLVAAEGAGVAYVPGQRFYIDRSHSAELRVSFSMYSVDRLHDGVAHLREALDRGQPNHA
jgi:2-aminoadipate transaminase